jgi:hypothetical protein
MLRLFQTGRSHIAVVTQPPPGELARVLASDASRSKPGRPSRERATTRRAKPRDVLLHGEGDGDAATDAASTPAGSAHAHARAHAEAAEAVSVPRARGGGEGEEAGGARARGRGSSGGELGGRGGGGGGRAGDLSAFPASFESSLLDGADSLGTSALTPGYDCLRCVRDKSLAAPRAFCARQYAQLSAALCIAAALRSTTLHQPRAPTLDARCAAFAIPP